MFILALIACCFAKRKHRRRAISDWASHPHFYTSTICAETKNAEDPGSVNWPTFIRCYIGPDGRQSGKGIKSFLRGSKAEYSKEEATKRCLYDAECTGVTCCKQQGVNGVNKGKCTLRQGSATDLYSHSGEDAFPKICHEGFHWWYRKYGYNFPYDTKHAVLVKLSAGLINGEKKFTGNQLPTCKYQMRTCHLENVGHNRDYRGRESRHSGSHTLTGCKRACMRESKCQGIDHNGSKCYFNWQSYTGTTHNSGWTAWKRSCDYQYP